MSLKINGPSQQFTAKSMPNRSIGIDDDGDIWVKDADGRTVCLMADGNFLLGNEVNQESSSLNILRQSQSVTITQE